MDYASPPDQQAYYEQVWDLARQVPRGNVGTYGQIAKMIPSPVGIEPEDYAAYGSRWVGNAMSACPGDVPWQRVINSQGKISKRLGAEGHRHLLEEEGIVFVKDKVDLVIYQWRTSDQVDAPVDEPAQGNLF